VDISTAGNDYDIITSFTVDPLKQTNDDYRRTSTKTFNYNGAFNIKFMPDLTYRGSFSIQYSEGATKRFYGLGTSNAMNYGLQPLAENQRNEGISYQISNTITYNKRNIIPDHNLNMMLGEELSYSKSETFRGSVKYLPKYIDAESGLAMMNLGTADPVYTSLGVPNAISSYFGRVQYDYKGKYLLNAVFRADGSSKFAPGKQWGFFPSAGLGWRISDERFMASTKKWLADLKLRASIGESGNNRISDDMFRKTLNVTTGSLFIDGATSSPTSYLTPSGTLANPDLKWETTITRNIGIDFSVFKHRLSGTVEVYKNSTTDLLISTNIPPNTGYTTQMQNIGETSNKGIEITLNGNIVRSNDFNLTASFNIGFNRNKIEKLGETKRWTVDAGWSGADGATADYLIYEGGKVGLIYGYETDFSTNGIYTFDDFTYNETNGSYTIKPGVANNSGLLGAKWFRPGTLKFVNQNPDSDVNPDIVDANDKIVIGDTNPLHTGGFNISADYKGFDLSVFFNWVYGNDIYNANKLNFTNYWGGRLYKNILGYMDSKNRWIGYDRKTGALVNDPVLLQEMNKDAKYWYASMNRAPLHSWVVEDGSFLRLNNLTVGYTFPTKWLYKLNIKQLRIYATGYNLHIWTNYSGYDPEVDAIRSTPLTPGVDYNAYPKSRSYNIGLNLSF
ncbi:MAG: SusC/RagA family TonB-linked outer membrane protein, partial [Tannerella sp.]|jgi:TonB-linked SusC/RagA family outer membrane protein|nr:SusC/RagA family TonB-linked outer membrane protein [Tannerella sp.]